MSIAIEHAPTGTPRIRHLSRSDAVAVGCGHSDLYRQALHSKEGHIADRFIAMPAHLTDLAISGIKGVGSKHDNPSRAGLTRARRQQIGTWLDLY